MVTINRIDCKIPEEVWIDHPCDYSNLKIFGCEAYALTPKNQRSKLDFRSKKCIFLGYDDVINDIDRAILLSTKLAVGEM